MIDFTCPYCGNPIHAQDSAAGKWGKCKKCDEGIRIPELPVALGTPKGLTDNNPTFFGRLIRYPGTFKAIGALLGFSALLPLLAGLEGDQLVSISGPLLLIGIGMWFFAGLFSIHKQKQLAPQSPYDQGSTTQGLSLIQIGLF